MSDDHSKDDAPLVDGMNNDESIDEEPIPKLPRAPLRGKLSMPALVRIGMFGTLFYAIIVMRKPCAEGAGRFITQFDDTEADAGAGPTPNERYPGFQLMTTEEALKLFPDSPTAADAGAARLDARLDAQPEDAQPEDAQPEDAQTRDAQTR